MKGFLAELGTVAFCLLILGAAFFYLAARA